MTAKCLRRFIALSAGSIYICLGLVSCKNTPDSNYAGVVDYTTPRTNLSQEEYPFDEQGNYLADVVSGKRKGSRNRPVSAPVSSPAASYVDAYEKPPATETAVTAASMTTPPPPTSTVYTPVYSAGTAGSGSTAARKASTSASTSKTGTAKAKPNSSTQVASKSKATSKPAARTAAKGKSQSSTLRYTVRRGDTLYKLANRYGTSVAAIKKASGMSSDLLRDGRTISIPR